MTTRTDALNHAPAELSRLYPDWICRKVNARPFDFVLYHQTDSKVKWVVIDASRAHLYAEDIELLEVLRSKGVDVCVFSLRKTWKRCDPESSLQ